MKNFVIHRLDDATPEKKQLLIINEIYIFNNNFEVTIYIRFGLVNAINAYLRFKICIVWGEGIFGLNAC